MGRNDRKHSSDAKAAVAHAMNVQDMTAEQIVALAAAGKLKAPGRRDRCRPFEIAESTVKEYARLARRRLHDKSNGHHGDESEVALAVRDAKKSAPQDDLERSSLLQALLVKPEHDRTGADLVQRRHEVSRRWVRATLSQVRAEHPTWNQLEVCKASGRLELDRDHPRRRYDDEWRRLVGAAWWHIPHDASPETIRQLHELLDREEAELEELEARYADSGPPTTGLSESA